MTIEKNSDPQPASKLLHVRCGSDIRDALKHVGERTPEMRGEFAEISDPMCHGPVPRDVDEAEFRRIRTRFIVETYGLSEEDVSRRAAAETEAFRRFRTAEHVVLWFEHDPYDQLILARLLAFIAAIEPQTSMAHRSQRIVELICIDSHPEVQRFRGLGQLSPDQLAGLWPSRTALSNPIIAAGVRVWEALRHPTPKQLASIATDDSLGFPIMQNAVRRFLQELPGTSDGLGLTERLTLEILRGGPLSGGQLFHALTTDREPMPFLGDLMYWSFLETLAGAKTPAIEFEDPETPWPKRICHLSAFGRELLEVAADFRSQPGDDRWSGGTHLGDGGPDWRWEAETSTLVELYL